MNDEQKQALINLAMAIDPDMSRYAEADIPEDEQDGTEVETPDGTAYVIAQTDSHPNVWGIDDDDGNILATTTGPTKSPVTELYALLDLIFSPIPNNYVQTRAWFI